MEPFVDDANLDPIVRIQSWSKPVVDQTPTVHLPLTLSFSRVERTAAVIVGVASVAAAWILMQYVGPDDLRSDMAFLTSFLVIAVGIQLSVSRIVLDDNHYTEVGAWLIMTVPLSTVIDVRYQQDVVALVIPPGIIKIIGPLRDRGKNTLTHGLPPGTTAGGLAAAVEQARRSALGRPAPAPRHHVPPGYPWAALAAGILVVRALTLFVL